MKTIQIILIFALLTSCTNEIKEDTISTSKIETKEKKVNNLTPIFIGLSPFMSDYEFKETIKSNEQKGILVNNLFSINVKNHQLNFDIDKTSDAIILKHLKTKSITFYELSKRKSLKIISENENIIHELESKFLKKYKAYKVDIPFKKLSAFNEEEKKESREFTRDINCYCKELQYSKGDEALYFRDDTKTVMVEYEIIGEIVLGVEDLLNGLDYSKITEIPSDFFAEKSRLVKEADETYGGGYLGISDEGIEIARKLEAPYDKRALKIAEKIEKNEFHEFGLMVKMYYFDNKTFDNKVLAIQKEISKEEKEKKKQDSIKIQKEHDRQWSIEQNSSNL